MILTATKSYQLIVEVSSHLASEGFKPAAGAAGEDYDAKVGFLVARWALNSGCDQKDIFMLSNLLCINCGYDALRRFCDDVKKSGFEVPYNFRDLEKGEFIVHGHPGLNILPIMDVYDLAARGRTLGWQRDWCPFRNNAEQLWYAGWDGADRESPDLVQARTRIGQFVAQLSR